MSSNLTRGWNVSPIKIFFYTCSTDVKADDIQSTHAGSSVSPVTDCVDDGDVEESVGESDEEQQSDTEGDREEEDPSWTPEIADQKYKEMGEDDESKQTADNERYLTVFEKLINYSRE